VISNAYNFIKEKEKKRKKEKGRDNSRKKTKKNNVIFRKCV